MSDDCLFCKIVAGDIPADIVYQDEQILAFTDINPQAPSHSLIIPKLHVATVNDLRSEHSEVLGNLFITAAKIAEDQGLSEDGYRLVVNCQEAAGQTVFHLHMHLLGGRSLNWPPG